MKGGKREEGQGRTCPSRLLQRSPGVPHCSLESLELLGLEHLGVLGDGSQDFDGRLELLREDDASNELGLVLNRRRLNDGDLLRVDGSLLVGRSRRGRSSLALVVGVGRLGHSWEKEGGEGGRSWEEGRSETKVEANLRAGSPWLLSLSLLSLHIWRSKN